METQRPDVCLIRPPTVTGINAVGPDAVLPLGLAYIAGSLAHAGIGTVCIDTVGEAVHQYSILRHFKNSLMHGLTHEETVNRIPADTEIVGIGAMFTVEWLCSRDLVREIRKKFPKVLIVLGGEHVTACSEQILKENPEVDVCVLGEGEETMVELVRAHYSGKGLSGVQGIAFRQGDQFTHTGRRKRILDIDSLPEPDWEKFPVEQYVDNALSHGNNLGRTMPIFASRGCPYTCTFCSSPGMWGTKWSIRKPEAVLNEMKKYIARYQVDNFDFEDLTAIVKKQWIIEFCKLLVKENLGITWQLPSGTRSEAIDQEVCEALYAAGCRSISYAPESGSPPELKRIKKRISLPTMLTSIRGAHRAKMEVKVNFVYGFPESNWMDVLRTLKFITSLAFVGADAISAFSYSPYPGSEMFNDLVKKKKLTLDEKYFSDLLAYTDPASTTVSFNENFSPKVLGKLTILTMLYFWGLSFVFRPTRLFKLAIAYLKKDNSSKILFVLSNAERKKKALAEMIERKVDSVVMQPSFVPLRREPLLSLNGLPNAC